MKMMTAALIRLLHVHADVVEMAERIQRLDVAPDQVRLKPVARLGEQVVSNRFSRNSTVAANLNLFDAGWLLGLLRFLKRPREKNPAQDNNADRHAILRLKTQR